MFDSIVFPNSFMLNESIDKSKLDKKFKKKKSDINYKMISVQKAKQYQDKYTCIKSLNLDNVIDYSNTKGELLIDIENDKVIGMVLVKDKPEGIIICSLYVDEEYRGCGFGEMLFETAINKYKGDCLGVYADNKVARRMYEKYGFKEISREVEPDTNDVWIKMKKS